MWLFILLGALLLSIAGLIYLISRVGKFKSVESLAGEKKAFKILIPALIAVVICVAIYFTLGYVNTCVILIHLTAFWLLTELAFFVLSKCKVKLPGGGIYLTGVVAVSISVLYLIYGYYMCQHVFITSYSIQSEKNVEPMRIVEISDSHIGTTFDGKGLKKHVDKINSLNPDVVLIVGDYVDGSSTYEDVIQASAALGELDTKYGVYFVYGNHDKNYYDEENRRDFGIEELAKELTDNGVVILEDDVVKLNNGYTIIGRADLSEPSRKQIKELMSMTDENDYVIDMNHQPNDYDKEEAAGVDLVLSGHTHGGQFFPIQNAGVWMKVNDKTYGYEKRSNTSFIVSSGISDWALNFKTGCKSEIVVIDIN